MSEKREGQPLIVPELFKSKEEKEQALTQLEKGIKTKMPDVKVKRVDDSLEFTLDSGEYNQLYHVEKVVVWSGPVEYTPGYEPLRVGRFYIEDSSEQEATGVLFEAVKEVAGQVS